MEEFMGEEQKLALTCLHLLPTPCPGLPMLSGEIDGTGSLQQTLLG